MEAHITSWSVCVCVCEHVCVLPSMRTWSVGAPRSLALIRIKAGERSPQQTAGLACVSGLSTSPVSLEEKAPAVSRLGHTGPLAIPSHTHTHTHTLTHTHLCTSTPTHCDTHPRWNGQFLERWLLGRTQDRAQVSCLHLLWMDAGHLLCVCEIGRAHV